LDENNQDNYEFNGMEFDWEGAFGNLTNERLEQLQKYARDQDYVTKFSVEDLPHEREIKEGPRNTNMKDKMVSTFEKFKQTISLRYFSCGVRLTLCPCRS
jgi:hypothetical protein